MREAEQAHIACHLPPHAGLEQMFVRHVDDVVQWVVPAHAALGFDHVFDVAVLEAILATSSHLFPAGTMSPTLRQLAFDRTDPNVEQLLRQGYADSDICAILGGNLMRVARAGWKTPHSA